ncbi:MAG: hypothetical protein NXI14_09805, partial [bacterium]|nr:hypothetical protein [bacterium]
MLTVTFTGAALAPAAIARTVVAPKVIMVLRVISICLQVVADGRSDSRAPAVRLRSTLARQRAARPNIS